jgi:glycosyltransferase involved in cell wall biosynthesis
LVQGPHAEETHVRAEVQHPRRPAEAVEARGDDLRDLVAARVEDLGEDERVGGVVTDEHRPSRSPEEVPLQPSADRELPVRVTERATNRRRLDQHLREAGEPRPPQDSLGRLGAGDPLNEVPDRHWTALGRTKPALLLSGAVTDGRPTLRHLGVNALFLEPRMGGIETYVRELYPAILEARPDLRISMFVNDQGRELIAAEPWSSDVELVAHPLLGRRGTRAATEATILGPIADRRACEVLHSVALTAPLRLRAASVVGIADVTWLQHAGAVPRLTRLLWRILVVPAARRADRVIAHSQSAAAEIADALRISRERIDVIPHGPGRNGDVEPTDEATLRARYDLGDGPIVLAVSAFLAHKNVERLVEAMPAVVATVPGARLVLPGSWTPLQDEVRARAEALGVGDDVVIPGWVSAADLEGLYRAAACFVLPSHREGFGLPVLEAMRRGVPVACSTTSALPEVAGDAAIYFDPERPEEIAEAVTAILRDPGRAAELSEQGRKRAGLFTWRRTAEETLASFDRALA